MSVLTEVLQELWSMFVGDRRLTLLLLVVVASATALSAFLPALHGAATALILIGAAGVLADSVFHAVRNSRR